MNTVDPVIIPIAGKLDEGSLEIINQRLTDFQNETPKLDLVGDLPEVIRPMFESIISTITDQRESITKAMASMIDGKAIGTELNKSLLESIGFLGANVKTASSIGATFSKIMASVPQEMHKAFNAELSDMIRSSSDLLHQYAFSSRLGPRSDNSMASFLARNTSFAKGMEAFSRQYSIPADMQKELLSSIVKVAAPSFNRADYIAAARANAFGQLQKIENIPQFNNYKDRLPERFRNLPDIPRMSTKRQINENENLRGDLTTAEYAIVRKLAEENPTWERALTMAGVATRSSSRTVGKNQKIQAGTLIMPSNPISKAEYAIALGYMDKDLFRPGLEGAPMYRHSITDADQRSQAALANKTSRIPTESFSAFEALKSINIDPVYVKSSGTPKYRYRQDQSMPLSKAKLSVRPDMFQIQSLTWDDFRNGVVLDSTAPKQSIADENAAGKSVQKMISQSVYTDLLGMHGHNTFGNGSISNNSKPIVMQLDLSDKLFLQKDGKLQYGKNGLPIQNPETQKLIEQIFTPNATLKSANGEEYHYPTVSYGTNGRYVPTNVKNGLIWMAEEGAYRTASQRFIDKYGANAFDNLLRNDQIFEDAKDLNKGIEARNRDLTPSVPFSALGGSLPDKRKIGFADFNYVTGLDGAAIAMPGYIPSGAGTVRGLSFKGTAMTADYKTAYRDVYGQDAEWFVPFMNAPESIKKLYKEEGIEAVRKAYSNPNTRAEMGLGNSPAMFNEHFFDMMKMDFVADKSNIKTPFFNNMSLNEMQDAWTDLQQMVGGLRMVQTASEFLTSSSALSKQVAQNLDLTPEDLEINRKNWDQYIHMLRNDPVKTAEHLFGDLNVPLNQKINQNPSLMWDIPEARNKVMEAIAAAENSRQYNKIFAQGDVKNALALPNIGELILAGGKANNLEAKNKTLANILSLAKTGDADTVALAAWAADTDVFSGLRFPNNVTEQYNLKNSKQYIDMLDRYQMNKDAMYLNMATIQQMGGGDVDGDTVTAARNRLHEIMMRTHKTRTEAIGEYEPNLSLTGAEEFNPKTADASDFANMMYRTAASRFLMAAVSNASDSLAQGDWNDPTWVKNVGRAGYDLKEMYDIDSTFMKTGLAAKWTASAQQARNMGKPFSSMFKDLIGAVTENDYSKMADFSQVNYPSIYNGLTVSALEAIRNNPLSIQAINRMIAAQESLQGLETLRQSARPADKAKAAYLAKNNAIFSSYLTRGAVPGVADTEESDELLASWEVEVNKALRETPNLTDKEREYYEEQQKQIEKQTNRAKTRNFLGVTKENIEAQKGYAGAGLLKDVPTMGERSLFSSAYSDEEDRLRLQRAVVEGANEHILQGVYAAGENAAYRQKVAESVARADNDFEYSWSMLHSLETGKTDDLKRWYQERIDPGKRIPIDSKEIAMGDAASKVLQEFADYAVKNNQARGTSQQWQNRLNEILQTDHSNFFSMLPGVTNSANFTQKQVDTYRNMLAWAGALPTMFEGEKILGAEVVVAPRMGTKASDPTVPVRSIGKIDLQTENMNGEIINTEMKPYLGYAHLWDQVNLYNPERNAKYARALSYGETRDYSNPANFMEMKPYDEAEMQKVENRMQNIVRFIQGYAKTGFDPSLLYQMFSPLQVNAKGEYVGNAPSMAHIGEMVATSKAAEQYYTDTKQSGYVISQGSLKPETAKEENGEITKNVNKEDLYSEDRTLLAKKTGQSMAKAMSLETDIRDYEQSLEKISETLFSKQYRADKINNGTNGKYNPWVVWEHQLQDAYLNKRMEFEQRGATKSDLARLDEANLAALERYEGALQSSASADFVSLTENIDKKIQTHGTTSVARGFISEFDSLAESIDQASQAYNKFVSDLSEQAGKDKNGNAITVTTDNIAELVNQGLISEDQKEAFDKAAKAKDIANKKAEEYRDILRQDANNNAQDRIDQFTQQATGIPLTKMQRVNQQAHKFQSDLNKYVADINALEKNGILTEAQAKQFREAAANISVDNFKQQASAEIDRKDALAFQKSDFQYNQFMRSNMVHNLSRYGLNNSMLLGRGISSYYGKISEAENRKQNIDQTIHQKENELKNTEKGSERYQKLTSEIDSLKKASSAAGDEIQSLSGPMGVAGVAAQQFGNTINKLTSMFGRRIFMRLVSEAKTFVRQFDQTLTEIQMITLKTDDQMSSLGDNLVNKAKELKVSIAEISQSAATLYRQGLSDEEVNERLDVISKFSKVSGTKVDAATKLITVAMNTGLSTDPQTVADIVTALGDNAATNASEIEKGIEKAGAAAAADGTTFAELASMLTAITSTTQLGGNVAGRTLNTIFGRMNKIGTSELIVDENGNKISGSAVAKLLQGQGINTYDEIGNKRSSYDVLYDLSRKWDTMSDAEQQQIATAIAGTRQYSNFAAIMQGMSEGKVDEYMQLAGESAGITDQKYQIYVESLQASLTDLKNTFDSLIKDLTKSGIAQKVIQGLTNIVQGVDNLVNSTGGLEKIVGLMITLSIAMAAMKSGNPYAMIAGAAVAGISLAALHASGEQTSNAKTSEQVLEESRTQASEKFSSSTNEIERARELKAKGSNRTKEEEQEYSSLISKFRGTYSITGKAGSEYTELGDTLSDASKHVQELETATKNLGSSAKSASEGLSNYEQALIDYFETQRNADQIEAEYGDAPAAGETAAKKYKELTEEATKQNNGIENVEQYEGILWNYNKETGEISLTDNWYENLAKIRKSDIAGNMEVSGAFMTDILPKAIEGRYITGNVGEGFDYNHYDYNRRGAEGLIDLFQNYSQYRYDYAEGNAKDWLFGDEYAKYHTTAADDPHMQLFMEQLMKYVIQRYSEYHPEENTSLLNAAQAMEEMVTPILPEDMKNLAPFIGKALASRFSVDDADDINKVFQDALIYAEGGEENRRAKSLTAKRNRLLELAIEGNYDPVSAERERQLRELGIQEGEEGDYYISEDGQILSYEDVSKQNKDYQNLINRQAWSYTTSGKESGELYEIKQGMDFATAEEAEAYRNAETSSWYFRDNEGNLVWTKDEAKAKQKQKEYIESGKARVRRTYYNPNTGKTEVYEGLDQSEEADAFQKQYEADRAKAFEVRIKGTDQQYAGSRAYGSFAQAAQATAIANAAEAAAYQQRVAEAEATRHGEIVDLYGKEAGDLIYDQINGRADQGIYVVLDKNRNFVKSFENEDLASQYSFDNIKFINNLTGESLGYGEEGRVAAENLKNSGAFVDYYIDGQYLGRGTEGLAKANEIRDNGEIYKYTNDEGKEEYTLDYDKASRETNKFSAEYEDAIQTAYENRLADLLYENADSIIGGTYGNQAGIANVGNGNLFSTSTPYIVEEYTDENGNIHYRAKHNDLVAYEEGDLDEQGRIKSLVNEVAAEYGPHASLAPISVSADKITTDNFEGISTEAEYRVESLKNYVESLVGAIPELKHVDPQVVLEVWGQLPEAIQEELTQTGEIGEEALKTVRNATNAVLAAKPQYKAIKNHFMAGVSDSFTTWQTENAYATTSDAMLRMIQQQPEITDLQSLLKYVNENDIAEWSILNSNKDFARLVAPLQLDRGIIQNSQEQQAEIYDAIIQFMYKSGQDYGARQLSSSQKAGYAQSALNKIFAKQDYLNNANNAAREYMAGTGMREGTSEYDAVRNRYLQDYRTNAPFYFESDQAAQQEAQRRATEDQKAWQEKYNAAYAKSFYYYNDLTPTEKRNGYTINDSGYVVDANGELTGERLDKEGYLVDIEGNRIHKVAEESRKEAEEQFDRHYRDENGFIDIVARENEYMKGYQWVTEDEKKYLEETIGTGLYQRIFGPDANATDAERAYASMLVSNRAMGLTDLTAGQKADLSSEVYRNLMAGNVSEYIDMDETMRTNMMSGISGVTDLYQMAQLLADEKYTLEDAISGNISDEDLERIFKGRYSANDLRATNLSVAQASRLNAYRNAANYKEIFSTFSGLTSQSQSEQISTLQSISQNQTKFARGRFALEQLDTAKTFEELDEAIINEISSVTGYTEDEIQNMWKTDSSVAKQKLSAALSAQSSELNNTLLATYDVLLNGADISSLGDDVDTETLATYFDESNAALANYIRTVGIVIKDGQAQIEEGTESIFTSLAEQQAKTDAANKTRARAMAQAEEVAFGSRNGASPYYGKNLQQRASVLVNNNTQDLSAIDDNLRYMLTLAATPGSGVTAEDLQAAYNASLFGSPTTTKYNFAARKLFGENGFGTTFDESTLESIKNTYRDEVKLNGRESPLVQMWDSMLSEMGDSGTALKEYLNGNATTLPDNFVETYASWLAQESFAGMEDAVQVAEKIGKLSTGRVTDRMSVDADAFEELRKINFAQYGLTNGNTQENRSYITSLLGYSDEYVNEKMSSEAGRNDLQKDIDARLEKFKSQMGTIIGTMFPEIEVDTGDLEGLKAQLESSADETNQALVDMLVGWINAISNPDLPNLSLQEIVDQKSEEKTNRQAAFQEVNSALEGTGNYADMSFEERMALLNTQTGVSLSPLGSQLQYMINAAANGSQFFTPEMIQEAYGNDLYGRSSSPLSQQAILESLFGAGATPEQMVETYRAKSISDKKEDIAWIETYNSLDDTQELTEALTSQEGAAKKTAQAMDHLNKEVDAKQARYMQTYGDRTDEVAASLEKMAKGGREAVQEAARLKKGAKDLQDVMTAAEKARGKGGKGVDDKAKSILSGYLGIDPKELEKYTKEELDDALDGIEKAVNDEFNADYFQNMLTGAFTDINKAIEEGHITYEQVVDVVTRVNESGDMSEFIALLSSINSDYASVAQSMAGQIVSYFINIVKALGKDSGKVDVFSSASKSSAKTGAKSGGGYNGSSGGGGGGGKSAADELIEKQKHQTAALEHAIKMSEIASEHLDLMNDYAGYNASLEEQIRLQNELRASYAAQIAELQAMMASVEQGSDDWYKLRDAIFAAEEAMREATNNIDKLNQKRIDSLAKKQENERKPKTHKETMLSKLLDKYGIQEDYANSINIQKEQIDNYKKQIEQNNKHIAEQERLLGTLVKGSQQWIEVRDKIWKLKEENAELENSILKAEIEIERTKLTQVATKLEHAISPYEHHNNILQIHGDLYQKTYNFAGYRNTLREQNAGNKEKIAATQAAIDAIKKQMEGLEKGSVAWYEARQALYAYEEALAQLNATIIENEQAIGQSKVDELADQYNEATQHLNHELTMLNGIGDEFKKEGNLGKYEKVLQDKIDVTSQSIANQIAAIQRMKEALNDPEITDAAYRDLVAQIEAAEEALQNSLNSAADLKRELNQLKLDRINQAFNYGDETHHGDVDIQHNIQMYQYEETRYKNAGELTNYGNVLRQENALHEERAKNITEHIENLKKHRDSIEDDAESVKRAEEEIRKWEQELAKENNTIAQNTKLIEQNAIAILKTRQAIENSIEQEVRNRIAQRKQMLSATVSLENQIIDVIRKNKKEEWDLEKKTIQKKKEALTEEKNLLNERLQARKNALDTEEKYEEIARLKKQLAIIQADASRTKEAKEIAKQLADLEKEVAWQIAEEQAAATAKMYDDQISSLDNYVSKHEEELEEFLKDSNNFRDQIAKALGGSVADFLDFMHENNENYKNATMQAQLQMDQQWTDTFKTMRGELETYWNEVEENMRSEEDFIKYMKESVTYQKASDTGKEVLESNWRDMYQAFVNAYKDDNVSLSFDEGNTREILSKMDDMKDWVFKVDFPTTKDSILKLLDELHDVWKDEDSPIIPYAPDPDYTDVGLDKLPDPSPAPSAPSTGGDGGGGGGAKETKWSATVSAENPTSGESKSAVGYGIANSDGTAKSIAVGYARSKLPLKNIKWIETGVTYGKIYKSGGYVDYTGPAWVDGTKSRPEAFLNADDTALLRGMLDAFNFVKTPYMTHIDTSKYGNNVSVGDVKVTINEAQINNDQDVAELAKKVGKAFSKELTKSGISMSAYNW